MSVYVDSLFVRRANESQARRVGERNGHRWCHMIADTLEELHEMADKIGMKREWFQPTHSGHYDLVPGRRALAVALGAVELTPREFIKKKWEIEAQRRNT